ncbi:SAM-dependent methyltransferase [Kribbella qitaiheensis]|nr:SAM-dependent methyltransferase [Kribbella qitaiheensis]
MYPSFDLGIPDKARVWNYVLGGKDHYAADRAVGDRVLALAPELQQLAQANEDFRRTACAYLAGQLGVEQFLDCGAGLPLDPENHLGSVREMYPDVRVLYVEREPIALRHAQALMADDKNVAVVDGDVLDPEQLLAADGPVWRFLDRDRPVAVLHTAPLRRYRDAFGDVGEMVAIMKGYVDALPPGSFTVISHLLDPETSAMTKLVREVEAVLVSELGTGWFRQLDDITTLFPGQALIDPGVVECRRWPIDTAPGDGRMAGCVVGGIGWKGPSDGKLLAWARETGEDEADQFSSPVICGAILQISPAPQYGAPDDGPILLQELEALPTRLFNLLRREGIKTADAVAQTTNSELLDLRGLGLPSLRILRDQTMTALAGRYCRTETVQLNQAQLQTIQTLMDALESFAQLEEAEQLAKRARNLRSALKPRVSKSRKNHRLKPAPHKQILEAVSLLAQLREYACQLDDHSLQDQVSELLHLLAPGLPRPRRSVDVAGYLMTAPGAGPP